VSTVGGAAPPPCSLETFMVVNGLLLRQVFVPRAATHNAPINCAIHNATSLDEQCLFLALL